MRCEFKAVFPLQREYNARIYVYITQLDVGERKRVCVCVCVRLVCFVRK